MTRLLFYGDPHGNFAPLEKALEGQSVDAVILLGDNCTEDLEADCAFVREKDIPLYWVHGNHDCKKAEWYDGLFEKTDQDGCLHGRVVKIGTVRVAGLGGKPRKEVWLPGLDPVSRKKYLKGVKPAKRWRDGLPLKSRCAIWPEDVEALRTQKADILVTHVWPSSYGAGLKFLDDLAADMHVRLFVHGHLHCGYRGHTNTGIQVKSVPNATAWIVEFLHRG